MVVVEVAEADMVVSLKRRRLNLTAMVGFFGGWWFDCEEAVAAI